MKAFPNQIWKHRKTGTVLKIIKRNHNTCDAIVIFSNLTPESTGKNTYIDYDILYRVYTFISTDYNKYWRDLNV